MSKKKIKLIDLISQFGKGFSIIIGGMILIHFLITTTKYYFFSNAKIGLPLFLLKNLFSINMIPIFFSYLLLIFAAHKGWKKIKNTMLEVNSAEIQTEKEEAILKTTQEISGLMAEHITNYNNEIKEWIESKKSKGQQVPVKIESASDKISATLEKLSETGFIFPYTENNKISVENYLDYLQKSLNAIGKK